MMNREKEQRAIEYLRAFEPKDTPYRLCYSGGKDSDCIRILAQLAGVRHDIVHDLTTVDAPETIQYIKSVPGVIIERPPLTMWQLIVKKKFPPMRTKRYCCVALKEHGGKGRVNITGVRWAESIRREQNHGVVTAIGKTKSTQAEAEKNGVDYAIAKSGGIILNDDNEKSRRFVEHCYRTTKTMVNPIVDWTDDDVWEFLHYYGCESNPLYQCGKSRIGCIGCPMQGGKGQKRDFARWPKYRAAYVRAFDKALIERKKAGLSVNERWADGESVMRWWLGDDPAQMTLEDCDGEP